MNYSNNSKEQKEKLLNLAIEEYLNTQEEYRSLTKLGEKYGIKRQTISKHLKELGYEVINSQNKSRLNEYIFDSLDCEEKFYWLGFMFADGNISKTGNRIEVRLSLKDLNHLEKFKKFLNLTTEIRTGICNNYGYCHLSVRNKHLWEVLNSYGCTPCKSLTLKFPKLELFKHKTDILHFIRGYVDGDGCLSTYLNATKTSINTSVSIVGTHEFLTKIKNIFGGKHGTIVSKSSKNYINSAYLLVYGGAIARKFARYLYENAKIYLDRKYKKYNEFCRIEEESSRRKSSKIGESCDANTEVSSVITKGTETLLSVVGE